MEEWCPISVNPIYEVSSLGRVRCTVAAKNRANNKRPAGRFLQLKQIGQYLSVQIPDDTPQRRHYHRVHKLVAAAFIGPRPPGYEVDHIDGDKLHNAPVNLRYVTHSENIKQWVIRTEGRTQCRGERKRNAVLTDDLVREARRRYAAGENMKQFAASIGRSYFAVWQAASGKNWKHVSAG